MQTIANHILTLSHTCILYVVSLLPKINKCALSMYLCMLLCIFVDNQCVARFLLCIFIDNQGIAKFSFYLHYSEVILLCWCVSQVINYMKKIFEEICATKVFYVRYPWLIYLMKSENTNELTFCVVYVLRRFMLHMRKVSIKSNQIARLEWKIILMEVKSHQVLLLKTTSLCIAVKIPKSAKFLRTIKFYHHYWMKKQEKSWLVIIFLFLL